jgi:hypothetical protein
LGPLRCAARGEDQRLSIGERQGKTASRFEQRGAGLLDSAKAASEPVPAFLLGSGIHAAFDPFDQNGSVFIQFCESVEVLVIARPMSQPEKFLSVFPGMLEPVGP